MTEPRGALPHHRTATLPSFRDAAAPATSASAAPSAAASETGLTELSATATAFATAEIVTAELVSAELVSAEVVPADRTGAAPSGAATTSDTGAACTHIAALDGIRALAVVAVLLYHAGVSGVRGGLLGVDVFFVLSGYLITGLLAREFLATGHLDLRRFYVRRARRLLPALLTVIVATCVAVVVWLPKEAAGFRDDASASAAYVTNWWFVVKGQSYFGGTGRPSLLLHLWSLAVEEQFYLLWPVFFVVMIGRTALPDERARALWRGVGWASLLSLCSIGLTAALYSPWHDPSRIYYGTDTRAFELFAGVLLALVQVAKVPKTPAPRDAAAPGNTRIATLRRASRQAVREASAFLALATLLWAFGAVSATAPALYPGGLIGISLATVVLIRALVAGCAIGDVLATRPLVWLGTRSYSLYLWHWPVFAMTRPGVDLSWPGPAVFTLRILLSAALAELTFRFIEQPIRGGALGRTARRARQALKAREFGLPAIAAATTFAVVAATVWLGGVLAETAAAHPADSRAVALDTGPGAALGTGQGTAKGSAKSKNATGANAQPSTESGAPAAANFPTAMPNPPAHPPRVAVVGDSQGMTLVLNRPTDTTAYLNLFDDSTEGCGLLGGRITSHSGERRDLDAECGPAAAKWASRAARDKADIALMMIGAWDVFDERVDGTVLPFGTPGWDGYFTSRLGKAVSGLRAAGVPRVDLALLPCYRPFKSASGLWPERGDDQRIQHVNALLSAFAKEPANHARPLFPPPGFCEDPVLSASRSYRWDGVHYYKPGARLFLRTAIPQLLASAG